MNNFLLGKDTKMCDLIVTLEGLEKDCVELAKKDSINVAMFPDAFKDERDNLLFLMGQKSILSKLRWALNGNAEKDGCDPSVEINGLG